MRRRSICRRRIRNVVVTVTVTVWACRNKIHSGQSWVTLTASVSFRLWSLKLSSNCFHPRDLLPTVYKSQGNCTILTTSRGQQSRDKRHSRNPTRKQEKRKIKDNTTFQSWTDIKMWLQKQHWAIGKQNWMQNDPQSISD